jgi:hypothetical protein
VGYLGHNPFEDRDLEKEGQGMKSHGRALVKTKIVTGQQEMENPSCQPNRSRN